MFEKNTCLEIEKASRRKNTTYTLLDRQGTITIIKGNILRERMEYEEIYVNNLRLNSAGRIIKVNYQPEKLICISENKDENGKTVSYTIIDEARNVNILSAEDVKADYLINDIDINNLYLSESGRLLYRKHKLTDIELAVISLREVIIRELFKGNTTVISKYSLSEEYIDPEEMKLYIPEYMQGYIEDILGLNLTKSNISMLLQSIVPQALKAVENTGHLLESETIFCNGITIESYRIQ